MNIIKKTKEHTTKLSISGKIKKCYRLYCMVVVIATLIFGASVTAFAANDPMSWMCIFGAAPFALLGFVKYNGMTAEKFMWAWIKSEVLIPKRLCFHSTNIYFELMKPYVG